MSSEANNGAGSMPKIVLGVQTESPSPFSVSAGMGQRLSRIDSRGRSNRLWREPGLGAA